MSSRARRKKFDRTALKRGQGLEIERKYQIIQKVNRSRAKKDKGPDRSEGKGQASFDSHKMARTSPMGESTAINEEKCKLGTDILWERDG